MKTLKVQTNQYPTVRSYRHSTSSACYMYGRSGSVGFMISAECADVAAILEACMKEDQLSVIHFLVCEGNKPCKIYCPIILQYNKVPLSLQKV
jgi:hypothetical protein